METKFELSQAISLLGLVLFSSVNANFKCPGTGRYLDPLSDCERFFFCYEDNGALVYATFKCPLFQLYSVEEGRCLTASNLQCKEITGATLSPYDPEIPIDPIQEFVCMGEGKFVNEFDPDCKSYITCNRISGQSYSVNHHYCPTGTVFSHNTFDCVLDDEYQCPMTIKESTTVTTASGTSTIEQEEKSTTIIEESTTTTVSDIIPEDFVCKRNGRYPNTAQPGCKNFIVCKGSGPFTIEVVWCNGTESEIYSPNHGRCAQPDEYTCPSDSSTTNNEISTTNEETSTTPEITSSSTSDTSESELPETSENPSPSSTSTTLNGGETSSELPPTTSPSSETTTENQNFVCTETGRFPNKAVSGCDTYILCARTGDGIFVPFVYSCSNSHFDPSIGECSLHYNCADDPTTPITETTEKISPTTTHSSTTKEEEESTTITEESTTTTVSDIIPEDFVCKRNGRYPNTAQPGCKNYLVCKGSGPFTIEVVWCNGTEIYSPNHGRCAKPLEYTCPDPSTTTIKDAQTTQSITAVTESNIEKTQSQNPVSLIPPTTATSEARSSDSPSSTTDRLISSSSDTSENESSSTTVTGTKLTESTASATSSQSTSASDTTESPVSSTQASSEITTNSDLSSITLIDVSTYPPKCLADPVNEFKCPDSGRYRDVDSIDCRTYILCLRTVIGELVYAKLNCEDGTIYSDDTRSCVSNHKYSCLYDMQ